MDDPIYAFNRQFPKNTGKCGSPIQCIDDDNRRHLLWSASGSSGNGLVPSDLRLKKNMVPTGRLIAGVLAEYSWQWNNAAKVLNLDNYPTVGVMAQEAQALFPLAVSTADDGYLRVDYSKLV